MSETPKSEVRGYGGLPTLTVVEITMLTTNDAGVELETKTWATGTDRENAIRRWRTRCPNMRKLPMIAAAVVTPKPI